MIKHVVFFRFDDKAQVDEVKKRLIDMEGKIEVLKYIEVGVNFLESERNFDLCLITHFNSKEDMEIYANHEIHVPVKNYISSVVKAMAAVDYEV